MSSVKTAVFPVGGLGTRFLPVTKALPKEMLPVVDRPLIQYAFDEAEASGIESFVCQEGTTCVLGLDFCGTCKTAVPLGQACGGEIRCEPEARCLDGLCAPRSRVGEACDAETPCVLGAACVSGSCAGPVYRP